MIAAVSPNGKWMAIESAQDGPTHIWLRDLSTGRERRLTGGDCNSSLPAWELDSKALLFASDCQRAFGLPALYRARLKRMRTNPPSLGDLLGTDQRAAYHSIRTARYRAYVVNRFANLIPDERVHLPEECASGQPAISLTKRRTDGTAKPTGNLDECSAGRGPNMDARTAGFRNG